MRVAPPVQAWSCSAGSWWAIQVALCSLAAGVAGWWAVAHWTDTGWAPLLGAWLLALTAGFVARRALAEPARLLAWDGGSWRLGPPPGEAGTEARSGQAELMLDLGGWMLVRFTADPPAALGVARACWLPLARSRCAAAWPALRVALHAPRPQRPGSAPAAGQPAP